ncbi:MAG: methyltransferase domain-containing protein, partial [Alphaproteobacteria bacterium]|nr:methyltransferase domain-containing protein [Alphaproteobacteria bacterium]
MNGGAARALALDLLASVLLEGRPLADISPDRAGPEIRAFARRLAVTTLRRSGQIETLLARFLARPMPKRAERTRLLLMLGMAQFLFEDVPAHAAVDTAVGLAEPRMKGLVNAVLRRCVREGPALVEAQDAARLNTPPRLMAGWEAAYGEAAARAVAEAHLGEAPLDLTIRRPDAPGPLPEGETVPTGSLRIQRPGAVSRMPGYEEGGWWVQDMAAALPARMLGPIAGERVLDLCAAPGGKTAQLAAAGARVTALDRAPERLDAARANLARLGLEAEWVEADAAEWRPERLFPAVLLDAPCSATGTIRRHPDILHRRAGRRLDRLTA